MITSFRRLTKSKVGALIGILFLLLIVASFALGDIANLGGNVGGGSNSTLAKVGGETITERDMSRALERRLTEVRQQNPEADYAAIAGDYDPLLEALIGQRALKAFGDKYGFQLSPKLIGAEIANIPGTRGLDGKFSEDAYRAFLAQQRLTDEEVRRLIADGLTQRLLITPVAANARVPVGMARPYASMLLEARQGEVLNVPNSAFRAGLNPSDADLQRFYAENRSRYTVPEQRVLRIARIGPEQVADVAATDQEIAQYYQANQATYGARDVRTITHAIVGDQPAAQAIANKARGGTAFAQAAGAAAAAVGEQTRQQYASVVGDAAAAAVFGAQQGAVVGPVRSDLGWVVSKVEAVRREGGRTLEQARGEIAERLTAEKRRNALTDLVTRIEEALGEGSNFNEAVAMAKLPVTQTPLITARGEALDNSAFKLPEEFAPALKSGFELSADDEPVVETLPNDAGYLLVAPAQIVPAAPAPLASIRDRVAEDWINRQAQERARTVASAIAAKVARGTSLEQAAKEANAQLPPVRQVGGRRLDISQMGANVPPALRMLFTLGEGKSRMVAEQAGRGYSIVKVNKIVPGNALAQPALIARLQQEFQQALSQEYAQQFLTAVQAKVGVKRNDSTIRAAKQRLIGN